MGDSAQSSATPTVPQAATTAPEPSQPRTPAIPPPSSASPLTSSCPGTPTPGGGAARAKHSEDFDFVETLGHGSFGDVVRAIDKETKQAYAIKIIDKKLVLRLNKLKYVKTERDILGSCRHPNIVKLIQTFGSSPSEPSLHYVMELCPNGELLKFIHQTKGLSEDCTRFYTAEIINALEYLHTKGIVHRDLKPENVLLSEDMHVKLTDFGTAKNIRETLSSSTPGVAPGTETKPRTNSFVGTPEYVPPEILNNSSVEGGTQTEITTAADLWSLGCIIYQMITDKYCFQGKSTMLTFERVKSRDLKFPSNMPPVIRDLVEKLLVLDPAQRLGAGPNFAPLKAHDFFKGIQFDGLWNQTPPPIAAFPFPLDFPPEEPAPTPSSSPASSPSVAGAASAPSSPATDTKSVSPAVPSEEAWKKFLQSGETVLKAGSVVHKKTLFSTKRILVLTNTPRLFYVSEKPLAIKGEIPWSLSVGFGGKSGGFFVHPAGLKKHIFIPDAKDPESWIAAFNEAMRIHREGAVPKMQQS